VIKSAIILISGVQLHGRFLPATEGLPVAEGSYMVEAVPPQRVLLAAMPQAHDREPLIFIGPDTTELVLEILPDCAQQLFHERNVFRLPRTPAVFITNVDPQIAELCAICRKMIVKKLNLFLWRFAGEAGHHINVHEVHSIGPGIGNLLGTFGVDPSGVETIDEDGLDSRFAQTLKNPGIVRVSRIFRYSKRSIAHRKACGKSDKNKNKTHHSNKQKTKRTKQNKTKK